MASLGEPQDTCFLVLFFPIHIPCCVFNLKTKCKRMCLPWEYIMQEEIIPIRTMNFPHIRNCFIIKHKCSVSGGPGGECWAVGSVLTSVLWLFVFTELPPLPWGPTVPFPEVWRGLDYSGEWSWG